MPRRRQVFRRVRRVVAEASEVVERHVEAAMEDGCGVVRWQRVHMRAGSRRVDATLEASHAACGWWCGLGGFCAVHDADGPAIEPRVAVEREVKWLAVGRVHVVEADERSDVAEDGVDA